MTLVLHNTLTGKKEPFRPLTPGQVQLYVCGPTVYDYAHLGHARCYIFYDVLARHLRQSGLQVNYVRNVTDVDDKIIRRAQELGEQPTELAARFCKAFSEDMDRLGLLRPSTEPKVSQHMDAIIALIQRLIEQGFAYRSHNSIYFSVAKDSDYGKLSKRDLDALQTGASGRMASDTLDEKRAPEDFALWKGCDQGEHGWDSPFGYGRPGWHIECSAMSMQYLGETLDLHGGGLDLVFPHHENELAQSECATGKPFVNHWVHNGFVEVNRTKMSKSLGNFFTARDLFERYEPEAVRYAMLTVHYRAPLTLDWDVDDSGQVTGFPLFEEAERRVEYFYRTCERLTAIDMDGLSADSSAEQECATFAQRLQETLNDDVNTPLALALVSGLLKFTNELLDNRRAKVRYTKQTHQAVLDSLTVVQATLGFGASNAEAFLSRIRERRAQRLNLDVAAVEAKISARQTARQQRDFQRADQLRNELIALGVELMDQPQKTTWRIP